MPYHFHALSVDLYLIRWDRVPTSAEATRFIDDHVRLLDEARHPLYFISDLRRGYIHEVAIVRQLARLVEHPNYGGSTAFGNRSRPIAGVFVSLFWHFARDRNPAEQDDMWPTPGEAIRQLEEMKPGITDGIDWQAVVEGRLDTPDS